MFLNYINIALRNFRLQKGYTAINVFGLAISIACSILIIHWVVDEIKVDRFHENIDQTYKIFRSFPDETGDIQVRQSLPYPAAEALIKEVPEIINATGYRGVGECLFTKANESFLMKGAMSHFNIFDIFSFPLIAGTTEGNHDQLDGIYISEKFATRYFGTDWKENVLGEMIQIEGADTGSDRLQILGVFKNIPKNSSIRFDFITNLKKFARDNQRWARWGSSAFTTFVQTAPGTDADLLEKKITNFIGDHGGSKNISLKLQAFGDTYLYSNFANGQISGGRIDYVKIFFIAALFLILMACINFINLTTARATKRAQEIGVRKVIGANRSSLIYQFMIESSLITLSAIALAIVIAELLFPFANDLLGKNLAFDYGSGIFWISLLGIGLFITFLAGLYPSFVLSSLSITKVLKNKVGEKMSGSLMRKSLVITQFVLSALLLLATMIIHQQVDLIKNKNMGIDRDHIIQMEIPESMEDQTATFKSELLKHPSITHVSYVNSSPIDVGRATDDISWPGKDPEVETRINYIETDKDFGELFNVEMASGTFHKKETTDWDSTAIVINQTAAKLMGLSDPVGTPLSLGEAQLNIIGVVKDFHTNSLHDNIGPLVIFNAPSQAREFSIRFQEGQTKEAIAHLNATYQKINPNYPIQFSFLEEEYERMYRGELLIGKLVKFFAFIAIFISCFGLLGLTAFVTEQKNKEIGIRKILGASISSIIKMLSADFLKLTAIGFVIALPFAWYLSQHWLESFAFKADIQWWMYLLTGILILGLSLLTVCVQSIRAAMINPVDALRNE